MLKYKPIFYASYNKTKEKEKNDFTTIWKRIQS